MNSNPENSVENFESQFEKELHLQKELEKVELTAMKLKEKYSEYRELASFIDYLKGTEQIFIMATVRNWTGEQLKKELINLDIGMVSLNSGLDEDIFGVIRGDFQNTYISISQIHSISQKLIDEYKDCKECLEFITYLRDISIVLFDSRNKKGSMDEIKNKVFEARMKVLSAGEEDSLKKLEDIYGEFKKELNVSK